nr:MAG TPA: hypothetical protein [Siphoviridae sp. ctgbm9]
MKKIMFNDKYGLTEAVLERRKTQTRRILNPTMLFERLNTYEGWEKEDIADWKESCKDRLYKAEGEELKEMLDYALEHSPYKVGENVAIAQRYIDLAGNDEFYRLCGIHGMPLEYLKFEKVCNNKMYVKADLMPHHIRITNVRIEKLQDISKEDVIREGFVRCSCNLNMGNAASQWEYHLEYFDNLGRSRDIGSVHAKEAYSFLIDHISGVGTWENNPFVFVYDFELL